MTAPTLSPFTSPPALTPFSAPLSGYLASNPTISRLLVSAVILTPHQPSKSATTTPCPAKVLLVQRAATGGFPLLWECPGGSVDTSDSTILHALQREVFEETGLAMTRVIELLDGGVEFQWGEGRCRKLTFLVMVDDEVRGERTGVVLNPEEHVDFVGRRRGMCRRGCARGGRSILRMK